MGDNSSKRHGSIPLPPWWVDDLREYLERHSQAELCRQVGYNVTALSKLLAGKNSSRQLVELVSEATAIPRPFVLFPTRSLALEYREAHRTVSDRVATLDTRIALVESEARRATLARDQSEGVEPEDANSERGKDTERGRHARRSGRGTGPGRLAGRRSKAARNRS